MLPTQETCSALWSSEVQDTKSSNICVCYGDSFHRAMLRSNLIITALTPFENLGFFIFYIFFFLKSEICKTEEIRLRFAEYSHFCCNLYFFPAVTREGPKMRSFHLNNPLHFSRGGSSLLAPACCRQNPSHAAPPHTGIKAGGWREKGISVAAVHVQIQHFSHRKKQRGKNLQHY